MSLISGMTLLLFHSNILQRLGPFHPRASLASNWAGRLEHYNKTKPKTKNQTRG